MSALLFTVSGPLVCFQDGGSQSNDISLLILDYLPASSISGCKACKAWTPIGLHGSDEICKL